MSVRKLLDLSGKVALITGGSRGLGLQIAEALAEMGAQVELAARKPDELEQARDRLDRQGAKAGITASDITQPDSVPALIDAVLSRRGRIDILVNNAGTTWGSPTEEHPLEAWQKVVNLNLTGTFMVTQEVGRRSMIPNRYGRILNIASIAGTRGNPPGLLKTIAYNTTKGGLVNFTRALAAEWGAHGITVNALAPGFFPSKMTHASIERHGAELIRRTPLARLGDDEDLKGASVLLCSDAARHITGQILGIDGGASIA